MPGPFGVCRACLRGEHGDCPAELCACRECWPESDDDDQDDDEEEDR